MRRIASTPALCHDFADRVRCWDEQGGNSGVCAPFGTSAFDRFTNAMASLNARAILTEFGGYHNARCRHTPLQMLAYLEARSDVFVGWTVWGEGLDPNEVLYLNPRDANVGVDRQSVNIVRDILVPHMMASASTPAISMTTTSTTPSLTGAASECRPRFLPMANLLLAWVGIYVIFP
jgi:hypothetical protein